MNEGATQYDTNDKSIENWRTGDREKETGQKENKGDIESEKLENQREKEERQKYERESVVCNREEAFELEKNGILKEMQKEEELEREKGVRGDLARQRKWELYKKKGDVEGDKKLLEKCGGREKRRDRNKRK